MPFAFLFFPGVLKDEFCISVEIKVLRPFFVGVFILFKVLLNILLRNTLVLLLFLIYILDRSMQPKCGFLPISKFIADENSVKRSVTRFKMHQALKFHQGKVFFFPCYFLLKA